MENTNQKEVKLLAGGYYIPVNYREEDGKVFLDFKYNKALLNVVKENFYGRRWHKEEKCWSYPITQRNKFIFQYLSKDEPDPFELYDRELFNIKFKRPLWPHQQLLANFALTRHYGIMAAEQGTGKTLALIEVMERSGASDKEIWYVAPISALESVRLELLRWKAEVQPVMMTYERMIRNVREWTEETPVPKVLIFDESSRLKGPTTQRTNAAMILADAVRDTHGKNGYVILATGTPAPKSPLDWWAQCEVAQPGFLKEGSVKLLWERLAHIDYIDADSGQSYPETRNWWDDEKRCSKCGKYKETCGRLDCEYAPSINEVGLLYKRLEGLVTVIRKKDVLTNLPDKFYRVIRCKPSDEIKNAAKIITDCAPSTIEALSQLRSLSDGFKYTQELGEEITCPICKGTGISGNYVKEETEEDSDLLDSSEEDSDLFDELPEDYDFVAKDGKCWRCQGTGKTNRVRRSFIELPSPKIKVVEDLLEEYDDVGRMIIYAGFQASIDRLTTVLLKKQWAVFIVDGRSWHGITPSGDKIKKSDMVSLFQDPDKKIEKIVWLANPKSSGMGLTLTASPVEVFYSNTFNGEDRMQAEDRAHRPGMDEAKGLVIIDIINLSTDQLVLDNIKNKVKLQDISLGVVRESLQNDLFNPEQITEKD